MSTRKKTRRGAASLIAMIFLMLFTTLATAMYTMSTLNVEAASNFSASDRARAAAESGMRWMAWRLVKMNRPKTTTGKIDATVANTLWPSVRTAIQNDVATMLNTDAAHPANDESKMDFDGTTLSSHPIRTGDSTAGTFVVSVRQNTTDKRYLHVTSTGTYSSASKSVSMDFLIDKKVKFAIVGKVPIQIGRNTLVEGPIATTISNFGKGPPIYMLSDFRHLTTSLTNKIDAFNTFLETYHKGYDNRISVNNPDEYSVADVAGYDDYNGDGFIDEYDLFVKEFDKNNDKAITKAEFTDPTTNKLYDTDLFNAIDTFGAPQFVGDPTRAGYADGKIDNSDGYTKVRGTISMAVTASDWTANLAGQGLTIHDEIQGPVQPSDGADLPVIFGAGTDEVFDLSPSDFDTAGFKAQTGPAAGTTTKSTGTIQNALQRRDASYCPAGVMISTPGNTNFKAGDIVLTTDFNAANAGLPSNKKATSTAIPATLDEHTPYGSTARQATYRRPVFHHMNFKNVQIPKGLNARFENCTFDGVTFVQITTNITGASGQTSTDPNDGMTWSKQKVGGGTVKNGSSQGSSEEVLTATNSLGFQKGNNIRFNNCTIHGPLSSDVPSAYTHFTNSWEFTGATLFDNTADQTATMICPQTNIEMGSFTDPSQAPSTLVGVVVAGNIDIRGSSVVDGSIIITGDGAGNTTQGWFGPSDSSTDPTTPMPEGGYGRLNIHYNPYRPLPDGINVAIDILPDVTTYVETQ